MDKHPDTGLPCRYIGDGVYAEWDGFAVWLRVNSIHNHRAVALEPVTMKGLVNFHTSMVRKEKIQVAKEVAIRKLTADNVKEVWESFLGDMGRAPLTEEDGMNLYKWTSGILNGVYPTEAELIEWINSFE